MSNSHSIAVLMSTFNGQAFLREQIDSILNQEGVNIRLFIRDDGSSDETIRIVQHYARSHANIHYFSGTNKGYAQSFLSLIARVHPQGFDYYCFSDQDDVWKQDKLLAAIEQLETKPAKRKVYCSSLDYVDENLEHIRFRDYPQEEVTLQSVFARMRFAGCTMVISPQVLHDCKLLIQSGIDKVPIPHDQFVLAACLAHGGQVIVDHEPHILYRRLSSSLTAGGGSVGKRLSYELKRLRTKDLLDIVAQLFLSSGSVSGRYRNYLNLCANYKQSHTARLALIANTIGASKNPIIDVEAVIKIVFNTF